MSPNVERELANVAAAANHDHYGHHDRHGDQPLITALQNRALI
jgi:hypothetical protein